MSIRPATPLDIAAIRAIEQTPAFRLLISSWSAEQHLATLASADARYLIAAGDDDSVAGFAILKGLTSPHRSLELARLAVRQPGQGLGSQLLNAALALAFREQKAHRLWLDVYDGNHHAQHLYRKAGFQLDGTFRESVFLDGAFHTMLLMSILDREYQP